MKKTLLYSVAVSMLFAASCKETLQPIIVTDNSNVSDTSYNEPVTDTQKRRLYIEELTGVTCVNCPAGAEELHKLSTEDYPDQLSIIAFHAGSSFTDPISNTSKQDFRTTDGDQIWENVWGKGESKPTAVMDRIKLSVTNTVNKIYNDGKGGWKTAIETDRNMYQTTPVNINVTSVFNSESNRYDITVKVKYTAAVATANALHVFLSQENIKDAQLFPGEHVIDTEYIFNHVFRKALTNPVTGKIILPDVAKVPGLVYEYKTSIAIDPNDAAQKNWVAEDMHVTAFVAVANDASDIHVMHVQETKLKN